MLLLVMAACSGRRTGADPASRKVDSFVTWSAPQVRSWLRRPAVQSIFWQSVLAAAIAAAVWWIAANVRTNMPRLQMELHWTFLEDPASFELGDNLVGYRAGDSYAKAFVAGLVNTLQVSLIGMALTAVLGTVVALLRMSGNLLASGLAWLYIEVARNVPLLLQLFVWQTLLIRGLPPPGEAWQPIANLVISNRGVILGRVEWQPVFDWALLLLFTGLIVVTWLRHRRTRTHVKPGGPLGLVWWLALIPPALALGFMAEPLAIERPVLQGFNFVGGVTLIPEFFVLLFGLVFCFAGFAAETIRSGIQSVDRGQWDAARSLGLRWWPTMRKVVLPQALRVIVPPMTSNFLSLTKTSSLAVAIGYPDLMRVSTVAISDTGRAVECVATMLLVYLSLSLITSFFMNAYNKRTSLQRGAAQ